MSGSFSRPYELRFRSKSTRTNFRAFLRDLCIKFWKLGFFIEKKLTFRFFRFLGKTFTFLIWFKQGRKNLQVKKMSRKKKCFKKNFFGRQIESCTFQRIRHSPGHIKNSSREPCELFVQNHMLSRHRSSLQVFTKIRIEYAPCPKQCFLETAAYCENTQNEICALRNGTKDTYTF